MAYNKKYSDWSRKVWLEIISPQPILNEKVLGQTPVDKDRIESAIGRKIDLNMAFITENFKYQNYKGIFKIYKISGLKAYTEMIELSLYNSYVRRIARVGTSKIDDSFLVKTLDGIEVRIKPLIITRFKANRSQRNDLRKKYREYLLDIVSRTNYYDLLSKTLNYDLQNEVKPILNKIFPVDKVEIRRIVRLTPIETSLQEAQVEEIENKQ